MERILVIGCPGGGKTTFANKLGELLHIPAHHLDKYFWKEGWRPTPQEEFRHTQNQLIRQEQWILDGNFTKSIDNRIAAADTIIIFDFPKVVSLWRTFKRFLQHMGRVRPDMGGNNKERLHWKHLRYIIMFPRKEFLQKTIAMAQGKSVVILRNPREAAQFLEKHSDYS